MQEKYGLHVVCNFFVAILKIRRKLCFCFPKHGLVTETYCDSENYWFFLNLTVKDETENKVWIQTVLVASLSDIPKESDKDTSSKTLKDTVHKHNIVSSEMNLTFGDFMDTFME